MSAGEFYDKTVVHEILQSLEIDRIQGALVVALHHCHVLLGDEVAFHKNMSYVQHGNECVDVGTAVMKTMTIRTGAKQIISQKRFMQALYLSGKIITGASMSTLRSSRLCSSKAYSRPARV